MELKAIIDEFDNDKDGFITKNDFLFEEKFLVNHKRFFTKYDNKNSERIYNEIIKL